LSRTNAKALSVRTSRLCSERKKNPETLRHPQDGALIIYTSGTTGSPKGVLHTHGSLYAQCLSLCEAWAWHPSDRILHCLPLHHIHGVVNAWLCAHFAGACVEFAPVSRNGFAPRTTWSRLRDGADGGKKPPITVFMGVPTMYVMLLRALARAHEARPREAAASAAAARRLRLAVSGSAACPVPVMREWEKLTGAETLLERYGMTEIGMALSNPLRGARVPGTVGAPLPGVETRLAPLEPNESNSPIGDSRFQKLDDDAEIAGGFRPGRGPGRASRARPGRVREVLEPAGGDLGGVHGGRVLPDGRRRRGGGWRRRRTLARARPHLRGRAQDGRV
jgi:acyl-CoA synthetase (AMP-forming)/AMP-acid ligase II